MVSEQGEVRKVLFVQDIKKDQASKSIKYFMEELRREGHVINKFDLLTDEKELNLLNHDVIVLTAEIWFGGISSRLTGLLKTNYEELKEKELKLLLFTHEADTEAFQKFLLKHFPLEILEHAKSYQLGIDVEYSDLSPMDKIKNWIGKYKFDNPYDYTDIVNTAKELI